MNSSPSILLASSPTDAAIPRYFRALAQEWRARGARVTVIFDGGCGRTPPGWEGVEVFFWPSRRPTKLNDGIFLARRLREIKPDCVVGNFGAVNWMISLGRLYRIPVRIAWCHTLTAQIGRDSGAAGATALLRWRKRMIYQMATHLVCNAGATARDLQSAYRVPAAKCTVFPYLLPDPLEALVGVVRHPGRIVCAGRLFPSKGQDVLLRALPALRQVVPNLEMRFLGDGPQRGEYQALAAELGVADICAFAGAVPSAQVLREMAQAAVVVVPSRNEAFGLVNIEAMSVGTPVVASRVDGIEEILSDGEDGFLVPPGDASALADRLQELLANFERSRIMGEMGRQTFLGQYSQERNIAIHARWYLDLGGAGGPGPAETTADPQPS